MSNIIEPKSCPKCGGPIPAEAPQGLCPKCLLVQASVPTEADHAAVSKSAPPTLAELAAAFPQLEILELIGQGGMGFVFKARQPKLERFVALKILPQSLAADPAFADRFSREGRVLARLNHPNIVTIHDFGQAGGFFYLLMEFVDGVNLRQAMQLGRFTPTQALAVVPKICEALQFAHQEGILHRDIKPENILLDSKGRLKIADFGIAKIVGKETAGGVSASPGTVPDAARQASLTGVLGTPQYMAPEQIEHPQDVDQRADIYSLGVVFYEMLTGELPIGRFAPPSEKSAVDPRMDEVVMRTLEKERDRRTASAGEVKTQVETIAGSTQVLPGKPGEAPARRGIRAHLLVGTWAAFFVFVITVMAATAISFGMPNAYLGIARVRVRVEGAQAYPPYVMQQAVGAAQSAVLLRETASSLRLPERWAAKYGNGGVLGGDQVVELLRRGLEVRVIPNSPLIEIRYFSDTPDDAAQIANAIAEFYRKSPQGPGGQMVDRAEPMRRAVKPNRPLNIFIGALIGLLVGLPAGLVVGFASYWRGRTTPKSVGGLAAAPPDRFWRRFAVTVALVLLAMLMVPVLAILLAMGVPAFEKAGNGPRPPSAPPLVETPGGGQFGKTIELTTITNDPNGISAWTSSGFPPGEAVVAVIQHPDGRQEDAMTQTITQRGPAAAHVTTVFSWPVRDSFDAGTVAATAAQTERNYLGRPLAIASGKPLVLFEITNRSGGVLAGSLQFRPVTLQIPAEAGAPAPASLRFSYITNALHMVLTGWTATCPAGHILQAGAIAPDGNEAEVSTSVARGANFDNESGRWDFPESFTANQMQSAIGQLARLNQNGPVLVAPGRRTILFSVTNRAGGTYQGFLELLAPKVSESAPSDHELARLRLEFAERRLMEAKQKFDSGVIDSLEYEQARGARDIAAAESKGDAVEVARLKLQLAESVLSIIQKKHDVGLATGAEVDAAKLARDEAAIYYHQAQATVQK